MTESKKFQTVDFAQLKEIPCPCGLTKRAFLEDVDQTASFHIVKINKKNRKHYHKKNNRDLLCTRGRWIFGIRR